MKREMQKHAITVRRSRCALPEIMMLEAAEEDRDQEISSAAFLHPTCLPTDDSMLVSTKKQTATEGLSFWNTKI